MLQLNIRFQGIMKAGGEYVDLLFLSKASAAIDQG
jgi:hypothetical protein